jgi:hypothetical protein
MVFFYAGLAFFILTTRYFEIDKALRIVFAVCFFTYAIYRAFMSYEKIKKAYFSKDNDEE